MSESRNRQGNRMDRDDAPMPPERGSEQVKLLAGRIACVIGLILAAGGAIAAVSGTGASISASALGIALGILGYFLGAGRFATATIIISVAALFFGLAASQGLIPGIESFDRDLPAKEPRSAQ